MRPRRYQVFVSSTFRDLRDERQAALEAVLELQHFPAGMEVFPASDSTPWQLIRRIIEESDYYVLIVGGRYGAVDASGVSYTEREYDLALELKIPVLVFLHAEPDKLPVAMSDIDASARQRLAAFRKKVEAHHCKYWRNRDELKAQVIVALTWAASTMPAVGWTRGGTDEVDDLRRRLIDLQDRHDKLAETNATLQRQVVLHNDDVSLNHAIALEYWIGVPSKTETIEPSLRELFLAVGHNFLTPVREKSVNAVCSNLILGQIHGTPTWCKYFDAALTPSTVQARAILTDDSLNKMIVMLGAAALIEPVEIPVEVWDFRGGAITTYERSWKLAERGTALYFTLMASRMNGTDPGAT